MANKYPSRLNIRRSELAKIHMAAEQLGMDTADKNENSEYRAMLWSVARVRSAAALDWQGRKKVLDYLKDCGAKLGFTGKPTNIKPDLLPLVGKIGALLADMKLPWNYAAAIAKRQTSANGKGIERLERLNAQQLHDVVVALTNKQRGAR